MLTEIYCKTLTYVIVGAGQTSLKSVGQAVRKDKLELKQAFGGEGEGQLLSTGRISFSLGKPQLSSEGLLTD